MAPDTVLAASTQPNGSKLLVGRRILIVEDQALVAMALEDMLLDLGCIVVGPALGLQKGMDFATDEMLDGAVLDINLDEDRSFPIAEILAARAVPFLFATGYGNQGLEPPFETASVLAKPYSLESLKQSLLSILGGSAEPAPTAQS